MRSGTSRAACAVRVLRLGAAVLSRPWDDSRARRVSGRRRARQSGPRDDRPRPLGGVRRAAGGAGRRCHARVAGRPRCLARRCCLVRWVLHLAFWHGDPYLDAAGTDRQVIEVPGDALTRSGRPLVVTSGTLVLPARRVATEAGTPAPGAEPPGAAHPGPCPDRVRPHIGGDAAEAESTPWRFAVGQLRQHRARLGARSGRSGAPGCRGRPD
jgi:hypothetical protein